jgi:hypothetical protein
MAPDPVMPKALQIESLKRIFKGLNPEVGVDMVDWSAHVEEPLTLPENRLELSIAYPQYTWFTDEAEMKGVKQEALRETEELLDYMLSALPEEMKPGYKTVFEDYLSRIRYSIERKLTIAPLKKQMVNLNRQLEEAEREKTRVERILQKIKEQPAQRAPSWTTRLENKLRDVFSASLTREGLSPTKFLPEYRLELETIRSLPTEDEMVRAVEAFAGEIVTREQARKIRPPRLREERPPPEKPPREAIVGLPPEEEEEGFFEVQPAELPTYPEKEFIPSRRLTGTEVEDIEDAFNYELAKCGKRPERFTKEFDEWIRTELFDSWNHVKNNFKTLVEMICTEKTFAKPPRALPYEEVLPLVQWQVSLKIEKPEEWMIPWKQKPPKNNTIEDVIASLEEVGKPGVTRGDVVRAVKEGWEKKIPSFINIDKEYLEKLIGEPLG